MIKEVVEQESNGELLFCIVIGRGCMTIIREVKPSRVVMGRLDTGCDLLDDLTNLCQDQGVRLGRVEALGAVMKARIGYYNQVSMEYEFTLLEKPLEITNLIGNVSLKQESPVVHAHITLADEKGRAYGGHLAPGTVVFACEFLIEVFEGATLVRGFDEKTGLPLWEEPEN